MRSWQFSATLAGLWLVVAVSGVFGVDNGWWRAGIAVNIALCAVYAFQAGLRLADHGLSERSKRVLGVSRTGR